MMTLEEQLRSEARMCSQCSYIITNPFTERCPRCLTVVPVMDPGCSKCIHNAGCPASSMKKAQMSADARG
ncbi:MAG: hypothetical protein HY089_05110 [Ignavibacteriales bacterium]|nr:hypothetical protein [Ignavibacteriales bacterium]